MEEEEWKQKEQQFPKHSICHLVRLPLLTEMSVTQHTVRRSYDISSVAGVGCLRTLNRLAADHQPWCCSSASYFSVLYDPSCRLLLKVHFLFIHCLGLVLSIAFLFKGDLGWKYSFTWLCLLVTKIPKMYSKPTNFMSSCIYKFWILKMQLKKYIFGLLQCFLCLFDIIEAPLLSLSL